MSVGIRPTFGGQVAHARSPPLDWDGDLYGRDVEVHFVDWLRAELKFDGPEALVRGHPRRRGRCPATTCAPLRRPTDADRAGKSVKLKSRWPVGAARCYIAAVALIPSGPRTHPAPSAET